MRHVTFDPAALTGEDLAWWQAWELRAIRARDAALKAKECEGGHEDVWRDAKRWLAERVFHDVCGYCEAPITRPYSFDTADHFRPKAAVSHRRDGVWTRVLREDGAPHPGYYWLAYEWWNIVPSCLWCNSASKGTRFPVGRSHVDDPHRCATREDLDLAEEPKLLNPYCDDPTAHLVFMDDGQIVGRTDRGSETIESLGLADDRLCDARRQRQLDALNALALGLVRVAMTGTPEPLVDDQLREGLPFREAVRVILEPRSSAVSSSVAPDGR